MKKKLNWFKIILLILTVIEIIIALTTDKSLIEANITLWRYYFVCVMFIPINLMIICAKRKVVK